MTDYSVIPKADAKILFAIYRVHRGLLHDVTFVVVKFTRIIQLLINIKIDHTEVRTTLNCNIIFCYLILMNVHFNHLFLKVNLLNSFLKLTISTPYKLISFYLAFYCLIYIEKIVFSQKIFSIA